MQEGKVVFLQIAEKRREVKGKEERERYTKLKFQMGEVKSKGEN